MPNTTTLNPETMTKYSRAQLLTAFEKVQNAENWKMPINAWCFAADRDVTEEAIVFFAGCRPTFEERKPGLFLVTAVGYYVAVGA